LHLARGGVELDVDVHVLARGDAGRLAVLGAERYEAATTHHRDRRAVGVPADGDPDRSAPAGTQRGDDVVRDGHAGGRLAAELDLGAKPHDRSIATPPRRGGAGTAW